MALRAELAGAKDFSLTVRPDLLPRSLRTNLEQPLTLEAQAAITRLITQQGITPELACLAILRYSTDESDLQRYLYQRLCGISPPPLDLGEIISHRSPSEAKQRARQQRQASAVPCEPCGSLGNHHGQNSQRNAVVRHVEPPLTPTPVDQILKTVLKNFRVSTIGESFCGVAKAWQNQLSQLVFKDSRERLSQDRRFPTCEPLTVVLKDGRNETSQLFCQATQMIALAEKVRLMTIATCTIADKDFDSCARLARAQRISDRCLRMSFDAFNATIIEGITIQQTALTAQVAQTRRVLALHLLKDGSLTAGELAFLASVACQLVPPQSPTLSSEQIASILQFPRPRNLQESIDFFDRIRASFRKLEIQKQKIERIVAEIFK